MIRICNNMVIVAGTGRNCGKTTFILKLIRHYSPKIDIVAIKVSSHFHQLDDSDKILKRGEEYIIIEETKPDTGKDSSLMLGAGAKQVYYIQAKDSGLEEAFTWLNTTISKDRFIICESGGLINYCKPLLFIMVKHRGSINKNQHLLSKADFIVELKLK